MSTDTIHDAEDNTELDLEKDGKLDSDDDGKGFGQTQIQRKQCEDEILAAVLILYQTPTSKLPLFSPCVSLSETGCMTFRMLVTTSKHILKFHFSDQSLAGKVYRSKLAC
jgi:hypothetical protein